MQIGHHLLISVSATQLLVGPASSDIAEQMKVRSSTRATSSGSLRVRKELCFASGLSRINDAQAIDRYHYWSFFAYHTRVRARPDASSAIGPAG